MFLWISFLNLKHPNKVNDLLPKERSQMMKNDLPPSDLEHGTTWQTMMTTWPSCQAWAVRVGCVGCVHHQNKAAHARRTPCAVQMIVPEFGRVEVQTNSYQVNGSPNCNCMNQTHLVALKAIMCSHHNVFWRCWVIMFGLAVCSKQSLSCKVNDVSQTTAMLDISNVKRVRQWSTHHRQCFLGS